MSQYTSENKNVSCFCGSFANKGEKLQIKELDPKPAGSIFDSQPNANP